MGNRKPKKVKADVVVQPPKDVKPGLDIKIKLDEDYNTVSGGTARRLKVTVTLLQDGVEIASDYDWVNL